MKKEKFILVLLVGLLIINSSPNFIKKILANEKDYKELTQKLENFIITEYKRQATKGKIDMEKIVEDARKLNELGLIINYEGTEIVIARDLDDKVIRYAVFDIKDKIKEN